MASEHSCPHYTQVPLPFIVSMLPPPPIFFNFILHSLVKYGVGSTGWKTPTFLDKLFAHKPIIISDLSTDTVRVHICGGYRITVLFEIDFSFTLFLGKICRADILLPSGAATQQTSPTANIINYRLYGHDHFWL